MMVDELGGIPAYELIKEELVNVLGNLSPTILFNIAVYFPDEAYVLYPGMVPASAENVAKVSEWITPLNTFIDGKAKYGSRTLGRGGIRISGDEFDLLAPPIKSVRYWARPAMLAMQQRADVVFMLSQGWGALLYTPKDAALNKSWSESKQAKYERQKAEAEAKYKEENRKRIARGDPPQVFGNGLEMMRHYVPSIEFPPRPNMIKYGAKDMFEAMTAKHKQYTPKTVAGRSGVRKRKKTPFTFNVIHFVPQGGAGGGGLEALTKMTRGNFEQIQGLDEIRSVVE